MAVIIEYRTRSVELLNLPDYWYEGDNEHEYADLTDALNRSDIIKDWHADYSTDLTVVRVRDAETNNITYIAPYAPVAVS